jgi:hypothetical protein
MEIEVQAEEGIPPGDGLFLGRVLAGPEHNESGG